MITPFRVLWEKYILDLRKNQEIALFALKVHIYLRDRVNRCDSKLDGNAKKQAKNLGPQILAAVWLW